MVAVELEAAPCSCTQVLTDVTPHDAFHAKPIMLVMRRE